MFENVNLDEIWFELDENEKEKWIISKGKKIN